jgi:hypothetical protein
VKKVPPASSFPHVLQKQKYCYKLKETQILAGVFVRTPFFEQRWKHPQAGNDFVPCSVIVVIQCFYFLFTGFTGKAGGPKRHRRRNIAGQSCFPG